MTCLRIEETAVARPSVKRILVVDDDTTNRLVVRALMERRGYHVTEAGGGQEAVDMIAREVFDLVLMDLSMPGMDGFEATKRIRAASLCSRDLPVFALTAHTSRQSVATCLEAGMNGVLPKPFDSNRADQLFDLIAMPTGSMPS
jgi:CheY-like chemotaxis protein